MARITGLATGLDVDTIVQQTMQAYRTKIYTQQQKKDILEIKQKLYRDVIKDAQELYNKHFDVLKSGSLISSKTWQSVTFTSDNPSAVTVTGSSAAKADSYTVSGTVGRAASASLEKLENGDKITINGKEFTVKGSNKTEIATNLTKALNNEGINISVRYTDFAGNATQNKSGFLFESKIIGSSGNFTIGTSFNITKGTLGEDAEAAKVSGFTIEEIKKAAKNNDDKITINIAGESIDVEIKQESDDIVGLINAKIKSNKNLSDIIAEIDPNNSSNIIFKTKTLGSEAKEFSVSINGGEAKLSEAGKDGTYSMNTVSLSSINSKKITINDVFIDLSKVKHDSLKPENYNAESLEYINKVLTENGLKITATLSEDKTEIIFTSDTVGLDKRVEIGIVNNEVNAIFSSGAENTNIKIIDSNGGVYTHTGPTNSVTKDGITFNFIGDIEKDEKIKISAKTDSTELVDKIKNYIEDYNAIIIKINTLVTESRNRSYQPLTAEQKKEMTETEIELWESKVKQGQLRGDSDLTRIANSLKQGMRSLVSGTGLTLSDIGIESVDDYGGTKDGTFKINEDTLKQAIENDTESIMKLFMQSAPQEGSESDKYNQSGIMVRLKDILYKETVTSKSILLQKVGFEGTVTVANNDITKSMNNYTKKIAEMEKLFSSKEQALYSKYAKLETIINNYNTQMSYLSQSLGLSTS